MRPHSTAPMQIPNGAFSQCAAIEAISVTASWFCSTITFLNTSLSDFPHTWHLAQGFFFILFSIILFYINYSVVTSVPTLTDMQARGGVWRHRLSLDLFGFAWCFLPPRCSGKILRTRRSCQLDERLNAFCCSWEYGLRIHNLKSWFKTLGVGMTTLVKNSMPDSLWWITARNRCTGTLHQVNCKLYALI